MKDIKRNVAAGGIEKPRQLRYDKTELFSRRIDEVNRLVYQIDGTKNIKIVRCKGHYED